MKHSFEYDVIIVGAGLVGLTLATLIAPTSLRIAIIDSASQPENINLADYDLRVSAITLNSIAALKQAEVWQYIEKFRTSPFYKMHVWDAHGNGNITFDANEINEPVLGYILENSVMRAALIEKLQTFSHVDLFYDAKIISTHYFSDHVEVIAEQKKITSQLLIAADGAKSFVRAAANIPAEVSDYKHAAIVAMVQTENSHQQTAWQRFFATNILAFLPLNDLNCCSIVWSTDHQRANELINLEPEIFQEQLSQAIEGKFGAIKLLSARVKFPLQKLHAKDYIKSRLALLGDAAHTIHPLAGQGVNLGIADAVALAEVLKQAKLANQDLGDIKILCQYQRMRKIKNLQMLTAMSGFKYLFSSKSWLLTKVRNLGLNITDKILPMKQFFMEQV